MLDNQYPNINIGKRSFLEIRPNGNAKEILKAIVYINGTHFIFRKWEFCGRDELVECDPEYINKHVFVLCIEYPAGYKEGAVACRHDVLVVGGV